MIRARIRLALPGGIWATDVSSSFPDATLRLLTGVPRGDRALELGEVRAENPARVTDAIQEHADIAQYEELYADDSRAIGQYQADERSLYEFLWDSSLPPEFPLIVADGEMEFDLTATQEQFDAFGSTLDDTGLSYDLLSIVHTDRRDGLLTDRQKTHLTAAYRHGYFEVPRETTLAEVANSLNVDKSSASETIRRGAGRIIGQFLLTSE